MYTRVPAFDIHRLQGSKGETAYRWLACLIVTVCPYSR